MKFQLFYYQLYFIMLMPYDTLQRLNIHNVQKNTTLHAKYEATALA